MDQCDLIDKQKLFHHINNAITVFACALYLNID